MSALGGNIGIGLEYNSPKKSKPGLLGEYFSNISLSGAPAVTRIEQKISFNWANGSPSAGTIPVDNFSARYTGFFVVPKTGSYQFGGSNDDSVQIYLTINGTEQLIYNSSCYSGSCYGGAVNLSEGDVLPIRIQHYEATGPGYVHIKVKGAVPEQIIPTDWLRTPLRQTNPTTGLQSYYYADGGSHTVPTDTNTAFASRVENNITFNYGLGSAVPTGKADNFISSHSG
jgi:hypothetical protein